MMQTNMSIDRNNETWLTISKDIQRFSKEDIGLDNYISLNECFELYVGTDKPISWIKSYKTFLKHATIVYVSIFNPMSKGTSTGKRYFITLNDIIDFIYLFKTNTLDAYVQHHTK